MGKKQTTSNNIRAVKMGIKKKIEIENTGIDVEHWVMHKIDIDMHNKVITVHFYSYKSKSDKIIESVVLSRSIEFRLETESWSHLMRKAFSRDLRLTLLV